MTAPLPELPPVAPGIVSFDAAGGVSLVGTRLADGSPVFPPRDARDGGAPIDLGGTGRLYAFTTIHTRPPFGLPQPYSVGYVDLDREPVRVFALVSGALARGAAMRLTAVPMGVGTDGQPCLRPVFETCEAASDG